MSDTPTPTTAVDFIIFTDNCFPDDFKKAAGKTDSNEEIILGGSSITLFTAQDSKTITISLSRIAFDKRMYHPGEFTATFTILGRNAITNGTYQLKNAAKDKFLGKGISLVGSDSLTPSESKDANIVWIGKGYYVHNISFSLGGNVETLTLHAFSQDKKLTLNKYCKIYTGKRFGEEIFHKELSSEDGLFHGTGITDNYSISHLLSLKRDISGTPTELVQPYLVQYNETFHNFLCRVANRCGEPLYFEKGQFTLGCAGDSVSITPEPIVDISINDEDEGISIEDFAQDYTGENTVPSGDKAYYNGDIGMDENFYVVSAEKDDKGFKDIAGIWILFSALAQGLQAQDFTQLITNTVKETGSLIGNILVTVEIINKLFKKDHEGKEEFTKLEDELSNLLNDYYNDILWKEQKATRGTIRMDFSSYLHKLYLCDRVTTESTLASPHLITRLWGHLDSAESADKIHFFAEAIPMVDDTVVPPVGPVPPVIKSEAVEAVVTDTNDPLRMGRIRVRYPWQESGTSDKSPWIRMCVPFAGGDGGLVFTPAKNDHVMLNFMDNNMERPYVSGALYHSEHKPPSGATMLKYKNFTTDVKPMVLSSASGQSISFIDGKGISNFVGGMIPPVKTIWNLTKSAYTLKGDKDKVTDLEDKQFAGGIVMKDPNGIYNISMSTINRSISISSPFGTVSINAFNGITISAPNGDVRIVGKNISLEAGNNISLEAGNNIKPKEVSTGSAVGAVLGGIAGGIASQILNTQATSILGVDLTKACDVSFLRSLWEVLLRPVEGTLSIKSNRNVTMTAGKGQVTIPTSEMSSRQVLKKGSWKKITDIINEEAQGDRYKVIETLLLAVNEGISQHFAATTNSFTDVKGKFQTALDFVTRLSAHTASLTDNDAKNKISSILGNPGNDDEKKKFLKLAWDNTDLQGLSLINGATQDKKDLLRDFKENYAAFKDSAVTFKNSYSQTGSLAERISTTAGIAQKCEILSITTDELKTAISQPTFNYLDNDLTDDQQRLAFFNLADINWTGKQKRLFRTLIVSIIDLIKGKPKNSDLIETGTKPGDMVRNNIPDNVWGTYAGGIKTPVAPAKSFGSGFKDAVASNLLPLFTGGIAEYDSKEGAHWNNSWKKLLNIDGCAGPRAAWDVVSNGNILISNTKANTFQLNANSTGWEHTTNPGVHTLKVYISNQ